MSEDGVRLLILVLIFFGLPLLDGILKSAKKARERPPLPGSDDPVLRDWDHRSAGEPTTATAAEPDTTESPARTAGEELLPEELWRELRRLAAGKAAERRGPETRGRAPEGPRRVPRTPSPAPGSRGGARPRPRSPRPSTTEGRREESPAGRRPAAARVAAPRVTSAPADERPTPPETRSRPPALPGIGEARAPGNAPLVALLRSLGGPGPAGLRRAVVLREVLGPPVSLRPRDALRPD